MAAAEGDTLTFALRLDGTYEAVAVALREEGAGVVLDWTGTDDDARVRAQLGRMLGLDQDGEAWAALGAREPRVGALQAEFPGFFTAAKASPYDAAVWAILMPRTSMKQAARLKIAMARALGDAVSFRGTTHHVFPSPRVLAEVARFEGVSDEKMERLRGVARAALGGRRDAQRLRAMPEQAALAELQTLRGIGPWAASHVLYRGAALVDGLPTAEPRVLHGFADAYGVATPSAETFARVAERWRPFRMWVCVLLARHLGRIGGWNAPGLAEERAAAGRKLARGSRRRATRTAAATA